MLSEKKVNVDLHNLGVKHTIKSLLHHKNSIILEGKKYFNTNNSGHPVENVNFSDTFKAVWNEIDIIISNVEKNNTIYSLKEFCIGFSTNSIRSYDNTVSDNMYIICQKKAFLLNKELEIYAYAIFTIDNIEGSGGGNKTTVIIEKITVQLFSYKTSLSDIKTFVENITTKYLEQLERNRTINKYIYTLCKNPNNVASISCWSEHKFGSTRTFDNMFFEGKNQILDKINFFLNNKDWYYKMGIPYSLGIGLYGPPGTGKTSFFKCLASLTKRHIVILSLKNVKTKKKLDELFFEDRYSYDNKSNSVGFDKKIIIIEDIDCLGELVWQRKSKSELDIETENNSNNKIINIDDKSTTKDTIMMKELIQTIVQANIEKRKILDVKNESDCDNVADITLDDILNLWDGIKETPGRILGISSNYYDKLDDALIRPGRIDISLKLDNVTRPILKQMFEKYYLQDIDEDKLNKINDRFYSPAEIINCYVSNKDSPENFMDRLMKNIKM
jgi:hypothetical protein